MKRVQLHTDADVRRAAVAIARWATNDDECKLGDPIHEWVTEGRRKQWEDARKRGDAWAQKGSYSSCGDLAHALLFLLGCRDERLVNRTGDGGVTPWRIGANLSRIDAAPGYVKARSGLVPNDGDILHVASVYSGQQTNDHVAVLESFGMVSIITHDYGQPYGLRKVQSAHQTGGLFVIGQRRLIGWLDVCAVNRTESAIVPDSFVGGVEDDNPYLDNFGVPELDAPIG